LITIFSLKTYEVKIWKSVPKIKKLLKNYRQSLGQNLYWVIVVRTKMFKKKKELNVEDAEFKIEKNTNHISGNLIFY